MRKFFTSVRRAEPASVAAIQRELTALREQHRQMIAARDQLAFDAVNVTGAAVRWRHLDAAAAEIAQRMAVLNVALPEAEARERATREQAEAAALARRIEDFHRLTHDARRFLDPILAQQVTGAALTRARELSFQLAREADALHRATNDAQFRRPLDPYGQIRDGLAHRLARIERAKWAKSAPITLLDDTKAAS